jgi:hypothetical protein
VQTSKKHKRCDSEKFISNNDNPGRSAMGLYIQRKEGGRELDSRETERESVCVREVEHCAKKV